MRALSAPTSSLLAANDRASLVTSQKPCKHHSRARRVRQIIIHGVCSCTNPPHCLLEISFSPSPHFFCLSLFLPPPSYFLSLPFSFYSVVLFLSLVLSPQKFTLQFSLSRPLSLDAFADLDHSNENSIFIVNTRGQLHMFLKLFSRSKFKNFEKKSLFCHFSRRQKIMVTGTKVKPVLFQTILVQKVLKLCCVLCFYKTDNLNRLRD